MKENNKVTMDYLKYIVILDIMTGLIFELL
jgi:hypothetical protein